MKFFAVLLFIVFISHSTFAQEGKIEIDSANGDTLITMTQSIGLWVLNNDSVSISVDFDKYSSKNATMYALVLKVKSDNVLSFLEHDSCKFVLNKNTTMTLRSVYVDAFRENEKFNNWIHFDYPSNLLKLLQNITSLEIKLYNLSKVYIAEMREEDVGRFNEYVKNYISLK